MTMPATGIPGPRAAGGPGASPAGAPNGPEAARRRHRGPARRRRAMAGAALGLAVVLAAAGCTGPVRSDGVYASKAAATAGAAASAVQTAQLAVQQATGGRLFGRTLAQALVEAASDAGDAQATFDAIQPPDGRADALRRQLDGLLTPAVSTLADLRTAARRGDVARLPSLAAPLPELAVRLERFQEAHQ
jgi:hypothetical protein